MPYVLIALTIILRLLPHPFGLTPVGALGLFAGSYCSPKIAWLVPLIALAVGDLLGGGYNIVVFVCVYIGFLAGPLFGYLLLRKKRNPARLIIAAFTAALIFFIVSNFGIWLAGMYPPTLAGLVECYVNGLPYFRMALIGDLVYSGILFGAAELFRRYTKQNMPSSDF
ncbi:MAG: hypothetical protein OEU86_04100 [Gammaproteobacteria bacterium]|nr:hypothetical protein [Gammaproteobacteria bacterium]